ncbi:MAG: hypothetical protein ACYDH1_18845 [Anaerolineaceae bacterium]
MQKSKWFILLTEEAGKMEVSLDNNDRPAEQVNPLMVFAQTIQKAFTWVNWFFTLSKIDRFNAGIDTSGEGRDE